VSKTHYETLGLKKTASEEDIREAYRQLARELHPDRNPSPQALDQFIQVQQAYETLRDNTLRFKYDMLLDMKKGHVHVPPQPQKTTRVAEPKPVISQEDLMQMTSFLSRGKYVEAEKIAQKLVAQGPKNPLPYAVLADVARYRGELKRAAEMYAFAAQYDPASEMYLQKQQEVLRAMSRQAASYAGTDDVKMPPILVALFVILVSGCFVALSQQAPFLPRLELISTWNIGLLSMLLLSGITLGACLSLAGLLDEFQVSHGSSIGRLPPSVILAVVATLNFWVAAALYLLIGATQQTFNRSTSMIVSCVAAVVGLFTLASVVSHQIAPNQTFLWGGSLVYLGVLAGWLTADGFRAES